MRRAYDARRVSSISRVSQLLRTKSHFGAKSTPNTPFSSQEIVMEIRKGSTCVVRAESDITQLSPDNSWTLTFAFDFPHAKQEDSRNES